jgi:lipopolysaccharide assembly outer membrane protein LptD (OstA)
LDQPKKIIVATYSRDTAGKIVGMPNFKQGENTMTADTIIYNIQTQKGITKKTNMTSGEIFFYNEEAKKISKNEFYAFRGRFTTCNLDTPHFAFRTKKMKLINQKMAVSGPIHPEFEGVPIPIYIPFGYFPISQGRHSGMLMPTFTASEQYGLGLENGGYYKVLSEYFDMTLRANLYSYGGWALFLSPTYRKRYRYSGALNFSMQNSRILTEDPKNPYSSNKTFNITWSHSQDSKARPGTSFSASVNAGSTQYNKYVANNPTRNFSNNLTSSITWAKTWDHYNLPSRPITNKTAYHDS